MARIFGKRVIVTIHSWRNKSRTKILLMKWCTKCVNRTIVVNKDIADALKLNRYSVKPAFLPPFDEELEDIPKDLIHLLKKKKDDGFFIVSSNAYQLVEHNGEDLYGLDLLIDLAEANKNKKIFFIFQLASFGNTIQKEKYHRYMKLLDEKRLDNILIYAKPISFVALIKQSDMTLRLTNTDGDALSIRESLYLNTPTIASDVVLRPEGTILFINRDIASLKNVFDETYERIKTETEKKINIEDLKQSYVDFYKKIYIEEKE
jgi:hypothetical protein